MLVLALVLILFTVEHVFLCVLRVVLVLMLQVEMFGVTADEGSDESGQLLQDLVNIERELFTSLALHFRSAVTVVISGYM